MKSFVISKQGEDNGYGILNESGLIFKRAELEVPDGFVWCLYFDEENEFYLTEKEVCKLEQALAGRNTLKHETN